MTSDERRVKTIAEISMKNYPTQLFVRMIVSFCYCSRDIPVSTIGARMLSRTIALSIRSVDPTDMVIQLLLTR